MNSLLKIIAIDDEPIILEQFKNLDIWEEHHFVLTECFSSAEDAEKYMQENDVDAILCDIKLPGMSGIEFAEIVKSEYPQVMFVLTSAYTDFEYAQQAIVHSVREYLVKPLTRTILANCLDRLFRSTSAEVITKSSETLVLQQILTSVVTGFINNEASLLNELSAYSLSQSVLEHPVLFFNVHVNSLEDYLSNSWQYGRTRLYNAISFILNQPIQQHNLYLTRYSNDNFECAAISKTKASNNMDKLFNSIKTEFASTLNIDVLITLQSKFESLLSVINNTTNSPIDNENVTLFDKAIRYIENNYTNPLLDLNLVSQSVFLSKTYFSHIFKQKTGINFVSYLNKVRIEKSKKYLLDTDVKISSIYSYVGYKNSRYFYKVFKEITGLTPLQYREKYSNKSDKGE